MDYQEIIKHATEYWDNQDYESSLPLIRELAEEGVFFGVYHLALCSLRGFAAEKDEERAKRLANRALKIAEAEQDDKNRESALSLLAEIEGQGEQPESDAQAETADAAVQTFEISADVGNAPLNSEEILYPEPFTSLPARRRELLTQYEEAMRFLSSGEKSRAVEELEKLSRFLPEAAQALSSNYLTDMNDHRRGLMYCIKAATFGRTDAKRLAHEFRLAYRAFCLDRRDTRETDHSRAHYWLDVGYWAKEYYLQQKAKGFSDVVPAPECMEEVRRLFVQRQFDQAMALLKPYQPCGEAYYYISICEQNGIGGYQKSPANSFFDALFAAMNGYAPAYQYLAYKYTRDVSEFGTNNSFAAFWFKEAIEATGSTPFLEEKLLQAQNNWKYDQNRLRFALTHYLTLDTEEWDGTYNELKELLGRDLRLAMTLIYAGDREDLDLAYDCLVKVESDVPSSLDYYWWENEGDLLRSEIALLKRVAADLGGKKALLDEWFERDLVGVGDCEELLRWYENALVHVKDKQTRKEISQKIEMVKAERDETVDPERIAVYHELSGWENECCYAYYRYALAGVREGMTALSRYYLSLDPYNYLERGLYWAGLAGERGCSESCMSLVRYYCGIGYDLEKAEYWARKTVECDDQRKPGGVNALGWIAFMRHYRDKSRLSIAEEDKEHGYEDLAQGRKLLEEEKPIEALEFLRRALYAGNQNVTPLIVATCQSLPIHNNMYKEKWAFISQLRNIMLMNGYLDYAAALAPEENIDNANMQYIMYILGDPAMDDYFEIKREALLESACSIKSFNSLKAAQDAGNIDAFCRSAATKQPNVECIKRAAMMGHSYALYWLGNYYSDKNKSVADRCYIESALRGYDKAITYCELCGLDIKA